MYIFNAIVCVVIKSILLICFENCEMNHIELKLEKLISIRATP